jgi:hypothetical protein
MNLPALTPHQPTFAEQTESERILFDAWDSLGTCIAHGLMLGVTLQAMPPAEGAAPVPAVVMIFPPAEEGGSPRPKFFLVGKDAPSLPLLMALAGFHADAILQEFHGGTGGAADYFTRRKATAKVRDENRKRIIMPGGN